MWKLKSITTGWFCCFPVWVLHLFYLPEGSAQIKMCDSDDLKPVWILEQLPVGIWPQSHFSRRLGNPTGKGDWQATVHVVITVGHKLATELQQQRTDWYWSKAQEFGQRMSSFRHPWAGCLLAHRLPPDPPKSADCYPGDRLLRTVVHSWVFQSCTLPETGATTRGEKGNQLSKSSLPSHSKFSQSCDLISYSQAIKTLCVSRSVVSNYYYH